MNRSVVILSLVTSILAHPHKIFAADFTTHISSTITIKNNSTAQVSQEVAITNISDLRYPTSYTFIIPGDNHKNLLVTTTNNQSIPHDISTQANTTRIKVKFANPVIGKNKVQSIFFSYTNPNLLLSSSDVIQVAIPPAISKDESITTSTTINLPSTCKQPESNIQPTNTITTDEAVALQFDRHQPHTSILVVCTPTRYVSAKLNYYLTNPNMTPIETQITLPPDTAYQQFVFDAITPDPLNLSTDTDGNVIASYKLEPKQDITISVQARAMIHARPLQSYPAQNNNKSYLSAHHFWPTHDSEIKKLSFELREPLSMYNYILSKASFNPDRLSEEQPERLGGKAIIDEPQKFLAPEYVDSFITLTRAHGIMSRRIVGYAETTNNKLRPQTLTSNSLHVWAEYFDAQSNTWIPVDPTWQVTSLGVSYFPIRDLNHIALAINGYNDTNPYPVGYYHAPDSAGPDIQITDIEPYTISGADLTASISLPMLTKIGLSNKANLAIINNSNYSLYKIDLKINANGESLTSTIVDRLPLKGQVIIPITLPTKYTNLSLKVDNDQSISITRPKNIVTPTTAIASCVAAAASIITVSTRRLLVSRRKS